MTHPVDKHVGTKIRQRRWLVGMTQQQLAAEVGIKFQQIQKYETGANRVSASRLWDIAGTLDVQISFFFEGLEPSDENGVNVLECPTLNTSYSLSSRHGKGCNPSF